VYHKGKRTSDFDFHTKLFEKLPPEASFRRLALHDLSSGKLPLEGQ
jgi:hypothetical protein